MVECVAEELAALGEEVPIVHFLPWWVMLPTLLACAFAVYLALRGRIHRRWVFALLVVVLAPALLVALVVASVALSVVLPELYEALPNPEPPAAPRTERTNPTTTTFERTGPGTTFDRKAWPPGGYAFSLGCSFLPLGYAVCFGGGKKNAALRSSGRALGPPLALIHRAAWK